MTNNDHQGEYVHSTVPPRGDYGEGRMVDQRAINFYQIQIWTDVISLKYLLCKHTKTTNARELIIEYTGVYQCMKIGYTGT